MIIQYLKVRGEWNMGIFDELNTSFKQSKNALKEADLDRQLMELNQEPGRSSRELSSDAGKARDTTA
jgi:hypothetical protein